ncbi:conserved Plasmodium protein, unknown function [Plasmodium knowlesi strain H]|uniref:Uncharacterized protein n=3 Tax=Plasmodium knowlesi TaxID=5850 RepID=A0A5K1U466_PLAKH|nr:conserved Plasmodium protein, unknown function [Plasmodium knowlesi strain H]OTN67267.1 Uncharacterized protein PKNOH_S06405500 [Plasmodium knowlesi]CAA9987330.1 conserved Plasmodium protein, unknown function [Plasmodium knowlesi strain H]SBO23389.1 conserved Plasmodium protein, unknown function [Plasmodium knowlesi strain H]SBO24626.1 conserved Plasmodium protein, unknown function [Plasmodium knowlesi strain H]VVS76804.1 conserved Plasmodium protein, unknown function [Plasmodium knowlesi s|eukprot:XP_002258334.1 hypothetical protein, conserved in Plasmodium species [Plasmodium knowlesi strain H]
MNLKILPLLIFPFLPRDEGKRTEDEKFFLSRNQGLLFPSQSGHRLDRRRKSGRYLFIGKNKEKSSVSPNLKKNTPTNICTLKNDGSYMEKLGCVKNRIINFFRREKTMIDKIKNLNEQESLWFVTGYAKNLFSENSYYHIIGFEHIKEVDLKTLARLNRVPPLDDLLPGDDARRGNYLVVAAYRVDKRVVFYKNGQFGPMGGTWHVGTSAGDPPTSISRSTCGSSGKIATARSTAEPRRNQNYMLCSYAYFIFYVYDKEKKKYYMCTRDMNEECSLYEMDNLEKEDLYHFLYNCTSSKKDLQNIDVVSLIKKNITVKRATDDMSTEELLNVHNYTNKFNSYLKRLFNMCHNSDILLENRMNRKNEQTNITFIFANINFLFKNKTYLEYLKNFFLKNDQQKNLLELIFKDNKGYKFYVQNDVTDKSSYVLRCTKISKKKFDMVCKKLRTIYEYNSCNAKGKEEQEKEDPFFVYAKILFDSYAKDLASSEKKKNFRGEENYAHRSIYINIGSNDYFEGAEDISFSTVDQGLLFNLTKNFMDSLVSCIHV